MTSGINEQPSNSTIKSNRVVGQEKLAMMNKSYVIAAR